MVLIYTVQAIGILRNEHRGVTSTYQYSGDSLKRAEQASGVTTTLVWDDASCLQEGK